jgi:hypothetical protein
MDKKIKRLDSSLTKLVKQLDDDEHMLIMYFNDDGGLVLSGPSDVEELEGFSITLSKLFAQTAIGIGGGGIDTFVGVFINAVRHLFLTNPEAGSAFLKQIKEGCETDKGVIDSLLGFLTLNRKKNYRKEIQDN